MNYLCVTCKTIYFSDELGGMLYLFQSLRLFISVAKVKKIRAENRLVQVIIDVLCHDH